MLSISISVGNSPLSLTAPLKDHSKKGRVLSTSKKNFIEFTQPHLSLKVSHAKNLPVCFVKGTQLSPL